MTTTTVDFSDIPFHTFDIDADALVDLQSRVGKSCACGNPAEFAFDLADPFCRECLEECCEPDVDELGQTWTYRLEDLTNGVAFIASVNGRDQHFYIYRSMADWAKFAA